MLQVWTCLVTEHDYSLVALAALACIFGTIVSIRLYERSSTASDNRRYGWLFLAGLAFGSTVWTTHFLAMLGYNPPIAHGYDPVATIISLFIAIAVTMAGFLVATVKRDRICASIGGAVVGAGVAGMHFVGMSGFMVAGRIEWDTSLVAFSLASATVLGAAALNCPFLPTRRRPRLAATLTLVAAVVTLHFTAMGAVNIVPDPTIAVPDQLFSKNILGAAVLAMMTLVVTAGASTHLIDKKSSAEALEHYRHLAMHDPMTGLPNRPHAHALRDDWVAGSVTSGHKVALLAIDLDRFKYVNDVYGHHAGDELLKSIAARMSAATRADEVVARIGGDEFLALKRYTGDESQVMAFASRIVEAIIQQTSVDGRLLSTGCSIGIAVSPDSATSPNELSVCADLAMYRAKGQGAEKICFYDGALDDTIRQRGEIAVALGRAIQNAEFELHYQPQLSISENKLIGFEALVRWRDPDGNLVPPSDFIPIAEETGQIIEIGDWVLRRACADAASWDKSLGVAINVSPVQIAQPDLPERVLSALTDSGLPAHRLEIEVTESVLLGDVAHTLHILRKLKGFGVKVAMDDFGTGYSSLSSLQSFPFDKIKIDQSFIRGVGLDTQSDSIVRAIISLAHSLSIPVVAEGVETEDHLDFLRSGKCDHAQGFLLSRPVPADGLRELVSSRFTAVDPDDDAPALFQPVATAAV